MLPIGFRGCFDQEDVAILVVIIESSACITQGTGSGDTLRPLNPAGLEFGAHKCHSAAAVEVIADEHRTAECLWQFRVTINLQTMGRGDAGNFLGHFLPPIFYQRRLGQNRARAKVKDLG
jgi:hypothetical protein